MQKKQMGLYVPLQKKFFIIKETRWSQEKMNIDRLRRILLARGLLDFGTAAVKGENIKNNQLPIIMSLTDAQSKGCEIEEVYSTDNEITRAEKINENTESKKQGFFRKG